MTFLKVFGRAAQHELVAIAKRDQLVAKTVDVTLAAAIQADHGDANLVVDVSSGESRKHGARRCGASLLQEQATGLFGHGNLQTRWDDDVVIVSTIQPGASRLERLQVIASSRRATLAGPDGVPSGCFRWFHQMENLLLGGSFR
jgi:hypothetical protein